MKIPKEAQNDAALISAGEYDIPMMEAPRTVLDIGAHWGLFTRWALDRWPECHVTAYEPWSENADGFRNNINGEKRVTFVQAAVFDSSGQRDIHAGRSSLCRSLKCEDGEGRKVDCFDSSELEQAEFVKIDAEGAEWEIITHLDLSKAKGIAIEVHTPLDCRRITTYLNQKGFAQVGKKGSAPGCWLLKFVPRNSRNIQRAMIAIPYYGHTPASFGECLCRLVQSPPCHFALRHLIGDSLVCRARNSLSADFLESDCTDLVFIDSDLIFFPQQLGRLLQHDADIVGGFYPKKCEGEVGWVCNGKNSQPDENGLQEVRYMGTGFLRIRRRVFEKMIEAYGKDLQYEPDETGGRIEHDFWSVGIYNFPDGTRRYLSEDWYFCQRWLDLGGKVYGDTGIMVRHVGTAVYPLQTQMEKLLQDSK